eukprot:CAMPEP_0114298894 /NCGR_PEP_ID=MMETSP0059-20121206/12669_1 /TAXON_ID=36894 /ORGANISM="Pyramimonas parkeae, Strain CCMP726" /LENGTH=175 /DNA_ID=CAMNT_0001421301 /DNA_START=994 /DNA_END=1517 /DNA_ORIENTATION=-
MVATGSGKGGQPGPTVDTETYEDVQFEMDDQSSCADVTMDEMQSGSPSHSILRGSYLLDEAINKQIVKAKQRLQVLEAAKTTPSTEKAKGRLSEAKSMVVTGSGKGGKPGPMVDTETYEDVQFEMDDQSSCADVTMDEMQSGSPSHSILRGSYLLDEAINKQIVKAKQRLQVLEA